MNTRIINSDIYRMVERQLYSYHDLAQRVEEQRSDILYGAAVGAEVSGRASVRADPTAQKVITMDKLPDQRWLQVIDYIRDAYKQSKKGRFLVLRYFEKRQRDDICDELEIEIATFYRWKDEIVMNTAFCAATRQLFR